jgi:hypothetical protein
LACGKELSISGSRAYKLTQARTSVFAVCEQRKRDIVTLALIDHLTLIAVVEAVLLAIGELVLGEDFNERRVKRLYL